MTIRQHESFQTNALDLAKFDQAIWNTAQGRPFQTTLIQNSIIQSHFSPILAIYAPLYWLWPNVRLLFIVQSTCLAGAGFLLYWFFRKDAPWLGLTVYAAYLIHPSLHQVNLFEFRRITTAVPAISLAFFWLLKRQYGGMALALAAALLSKENTAFFGIGVGIYLILAHRTLKIGLPVLLLSAGWLILVPLLVLPAVGTPQFLPENEGYSLAGKYFSYLGHSPIEMIETLLRSPGVMLEYILRPERLKAVLNLLWPIGFLPFLSPEVAAFGLPFLGYSLASSSNTMGQLEAWYPSVLLPLLYWAAAIGISRLHDPWRTAALIVLLTAAIAGYATLSEVRPARLAETRRFTVTDYHRRIEIALKQIPVGAVVVAQDPLVPHLSHREQIYLFPWVPVEVDPDYIVLDRDMRTYPMERPAYRTSFYDLLAGTKYGIDQQINNFFVFRYAGRVTPTFGLADQFSGLFTLTGFSTALAPPGEAFGSIPEELPAGSTMRISLFWHIDKPVEQNYTVFVHASGQEDQLLAQHDSWPADAHRPTSVLPTGTAFRDVHYLTLSQSASSDEIKLHVGVYDGNGDRLLTREGQEFVVLNLQR